MSNVFLALAVVHVVIALALASRFAGLELLLQRAAAIVIGVGVAMAADNLIIGLGSRIGPSELLADLNRLRLLLHLLVVPLVILGAVFLGQAADLPFTRRLTQPAQLLTIAMIAWGVLVDGLWPPLEPVTSSGVVRYVPHDPFVPVPAIVAVAAALVIGGTLWREGVTRWLLLGSVIMFVGSATSAVERPLIGNLAEVGFLAGLAATVVVLARRAVAPRHAPLTG